MWGTLRDDLLTMEHQYLSPAQMGVLVEIRHSGTPTWQWTITYV